MSAIKSLDTEIVDYLPKLNIKQKKTILSVVKTFAAEQEDWWDEISEEQQNAIDKSLAQMNTQKLTPNATVFKKFGK